LLSVLSDGNYAVNRAIDRRGSQGIALPVTSRHVHGHCIGRSEVETFRAGDIGLGRYKANPAMAIDRELRSGKMYRQACHPLERNEQRRNHDVDDHRSGRFFFGYGVYCSSIDM
jgi:hypothetical protein